MHIIQDSGWSEMSIANGVCVLNETQFWGEPCTRGAGTSIGDLFPFYFTNAPSSQFAISMAVQIAGIFIAVHKAGICNPKICSANSGQMG